MNRIPIRRASVVLLAACSLLGLTTGRVLAQLPNPVAILKFDEGHGNLAHDSSNNGHNANLIGAAGWTTGIIIGHSALSLPGVSGAYAQIPGPVVNTLQSFSITAWVKLNNTNGFQTFVSEDTNVESAFFLQLRGDSGQFSFTVPYTFFLNPQSGFNPVVGQWYHLAGVYDAEGRSASLYVNGVLTDTIYNVVPNQATGETAVGRGQFNSNQVDWNNDAIDDVQFYQQALNADQVLTIAREDNSSLPGPGSVEPATLSIDGSHPGAKLNPRFYGLMVEEINHAFDGGIYGELIQNRVLKDDPNVPAHWSILPYDDGSISLDTNEPVPNTALTTSLRVQVNKNRVRVANDGYWGFPIEPATVYRASFWAKAAPGFNGPITVSLTSSDGSDVYARQNASTLNGTWTKYEVELKTRAGLKPTTDAVFVLSANSPGTYWFTQASLFQPTYNDRPNGNRIDLMQKLAAIHPGFLRLPGGNYLEGNSIDQRFEWKNTIGPIEQRPGHESPWGYRSDDGLGLLEFAEWCEDIGMEPLLAVYAGYSLNGTHVNPGTDLDPYVQDALDEIQYLTGDVTTTWGAKRAADGHPAPFPLEYVEIGNEDFFDGSGSYDARFAQFFDAIRGAYPKLKIIATASVTMRTPDILDQHFYETPRSIERDAHHYDSFSRSGPLIMVGEYASQSGTPTPDLNAAIGDAAWLTGLERNADLVILTSYAPLFVNINQGARQWPTNLIGYDALRSYGSPSYYAHVMFSTNHGDTVLPATLTATGGSQVFQSVTRDSATGTIYAKVVNAANDPQPVHFTLSGLGSVAAKGQVITLTSASPQDTNTVDDPRHVVPVESQVTNLGPQFDLTFAPNSVTIVKIHAK